MSNIRIYRLPKSEDLDVLKTQSRPLKIARLKSLKEDPANFYSKYENEINQNQEFWLDRIRPRFVEHFTAVISDTNGSSDETLTIDDKTEFISVGVVINEYEEELADAAQAGTTLQVQPSEKTPVYFLGVLWVDKSLRGQGVGSRMINESIAWIKEDAKSRGWPKVRYRVTALDGNARAIKLYQSLGFDIDRVKVQGQDPDDVFTDMSMVLDIV